MEDFLTLKQNNLPKNDTGQLINESIRAVRIQVVNQDGENIGVITKEEALKLAKIAQLDLVMVADMGAEGVPVAKIMDFGKLLYAKKKKHAEAKKHQKTVQVKEIKMRTKIGEHDYQTKLKQGIQFLKEGKYLKITLMFKGREAASSQERGSLMFEKINQTLQEEGFDNIIQEKETKSSSSWSRIYFLK